MFFISLQSRLLGHVNPNLIFKGRRVVVTQAAAYSLNSVGGDPVICDEKRFERLLYALSSIVVLQFVVIAWLMLFNASFVPQVAAQTSPEILRVRGLVIEDGQGHPRILLGAPFPAAAGRVRTDTRTTAMIFLDAEGHDRLTLGEELDPQIGGKVPTGIHRIASGYGVVLHDNIGDERGAYSWLTNGRALITLDRPGAEAFAAIVNDKTGESKITFSFPPEIAGDASAIEIGTKKNRAFLDFKSKTGATISSTETLGGEGPLHLLNGSQIDHKSMHQQSGPER
jgi:hypothetical protein